MAGARIGCLDGLRGAAALWVLIGHAMLLTGLRVPLLSSPDLAVDLFILLSGFLMAYHAERSRDDQGQPATWAKFWAKRFFRIAPLYWMAVVFYWFAYQIQAEPRPTGTDARAIQVARGGIPCGLVSVPLRYMHTPTEVVCLKDLQATVDLLVRTVLSHVMQPSGHPEDVPVALAAAITRLLED